MIATTIINSMSVKPDTCFDMTGLPEPRWDNRKDAVFVPNLTLRALFLRITVLIYHGSIGKAWSGCPVERSTSIERS